MKKGTKHTKSQIAEETLYRSAVKLFRECGFEHTTMREIADTADVSLGLAYRYFESKNDFVAKLYIEVTGQLDEATDGLKASGLGKMFVQRLKLKMEILSEDLELWQEILPLMMSRTSSLGILSEQQSFLRQSNLRTLTSMTDKANNRAILKLKSGETAVLLYFIEMLVTLFFLMQAPGVKSFALPLDSLETIVDKLPLLRRVPGVSKLSDEIIKAFKHLLQ